jgi:hypothetical protein
MSVITETRMSVCRACGKVMILNLAAQSGRWLHFTPDGTAEPGRGCGPKYGAGQRSRVTDHQRAGLGMVLLVEHEARRWSVEACLVPHGTTYVAWPEWVLRDGYDCRVPGEQCMRGTTRREARTAFADEILLLDTEMDLTALSAWTVARARHYRDKPGRAWLK